MKNGRVIINGIKIRPHEKGDINTFYLLVNAGFISIDGSNFGQHEVIVTINSKDSMKDISSKILSTIIQELIGRGISLEEKDIILFPYFGVV